MSVCCCVVVYSWLWPVFVWWLYCGLMWAMAGVSVVAVLWCTVGFGRCGCGDYVVVYSGLWLMSMWCCVVVYSRLWPVFVWWLCCCLKWAVAGVCMVAVLLSKVGCGRCLYGGCVVVYSRLWPVFVWWLCCCLKWAVAGVCMVAVLLSKVGCGRCLCGGCVKGIKNGCPCIVEIYYDDVIMTMLASQITSLTVVSSIVCSGVNQRKHQSSASLAFVWEIHRGPVNFPHKWPVTRKMFPFDYVIMRCTQGCALVGDPARAVGECRDVAKAQP